MQKTIAVVNDDMTYRTAATKHFVRCSILRLRTSRRPPRRPAIKIALTTKIGKYPRGVSSHFGKQVRAINAGAPWRSRQSHGQSHGRTRCLLLPF